jgi:hypothetical protein
MLDRARWTGKLDEAEVYRRWLVNKLSAPLTKVADTKTQLREVEYVEDT